MKLIFLGIIILLVITTISAEDYSNCDMKIYSLHEELGDCQTHNLPNCTGTYRVAECPDGIKILEKISDDLNKEDICKLYNIGCEGTSNEQIANLSAQVIELNKRVNEQETLLQKIMNFFKSIFGVTI